MIRNTAIFLVALFLIFPAGVFSQNQQSPSAGALRDYVGLINKTYHPDIVAYFEKMKEELAKKGETNAVKAIDVFLGLGGGFGSGFVFNDAKGGLYILTNYHVIAQAYTLSITFERQDGSKKKFENLTIVAADEENDLALLAFAPGDKPVDQGLRFLTRAIQEGEDVYSAGFPGLGVTPIWQLGRGMISNANVRFPKSILDETMMGPYIQHTAQIDGGNSGGPLLIPQANVPSGYVVAGVNTLSGARRQAANYSIPVSTTQAFLNDAFNPKPETYRPALDARLASFLEGLGANKAVYPHIAEYLSSACVGENAEYAISEMYDKGNASIRRAFLDKFDDGVVAAMGYAVAWTIENSIRGKGAIKAEIKEVVEDGDDYTVIFTISGKDHSSKWIREYGNWRIRSFGAVAAGDKTLVSQKEAKKKVEQNLKTESNIHLEVGYATLFEQHPAALYLSAEFLKMMGFKAYFTNGFFAIGAFVGMRWDIPSGNVAFMPYIRLGLDYLHNTLDDKNEEALLGVFDAFRLNGQAGLKFTTSYVPGLFMGVGFQYNIPSLFDMAETASGGSRRSMEMGLSITAGYAF